MSFTNTHWCLGKSTNHRSNSRHKKVKGLTGIKRTGFLVIINDTIINQFLDQPTRPMYSKGIRSKRFAIDSCTAAIIRGVLHAKRSTIFRRANLKTVLFCVHIIIIYCIFIIIIYCICVCTGLFTIQYILILYRPKCGSVQHAHSRSGTIHVHAKSWMRAASRSLGLNE
jgi:hypothetical protein